MRYEEHLERVKQAVLDSPGRCRAELRRAVEQRSAERGGRPRGPRAEVPPAMATYVEKVSRHAYKVTDEDVQALKNAGYTEDQIFEITVSAALGASRARLERGLAALYGETAAKPKESR